MGYQVLARKYRPQHFADVAGQDHVTRTLLNALNQNRIAHGYIFSGHRGIGKTTIARILAQALNCRETIGSPEKPNPARPTAEPCGQCDSCREIRQGNAVDVIEIDAATNRGIDEIRELRDAARYSPARDRYKIYILDEAHQITDAAFNALLKTLEEPPPHIIFMMATTEPESIPQTIRSRCQHFSFHAVKFDDIFAQLKAIASEEGVTAEDDALALLAEAGDGSMRDALSIMDQAIASAPLEPDASGVARAVLQADQIRELMGAVPNAVFERLMEAVSAQQPATLMQELDRLIGAGNSPAALARQLVRYLRNCLMAKLGGENTGLLEIAHDERARATRTALLFTEDELTRNLQIALRTFDDLNYRQEQRFHLELGLLKLIQAQRLLPVEEILSGLASSAAAKRANPAPSSSASPSRQSAAPTASSAAQARPAALPSSQLSPFFSAGQRPSEPSLAEPGGGFTPRITPAEPIGASAPESRSRNTSFSEAATEGALALAGVAEANAETISLEPKPGPELLPSLSAASPDPVPSGEPGIEPIRSAVLQALVSGGHATAATLLEDGRWNVEASSVRIEVNVKATMIRITFNAAAEKLIRQGLAQAGAPTRFMIVPGEGLASLSGSARPRAPLGSIENEARANPLVVQAQSLFNAEIVTVIDLRT